MGARDTLLIGAMSMVASAGVEAKCPPYQCRLVTIEATQCTVRLVDFVTEASTIIDEIPLSPGMYTKEQLLALVRPGNMSGVQVNAPSEISVEVPCSAGARLVGNKSAPAPDPKQPVSYFFETNDRNACVRFLGRRVTLFNSVPCCDTIPPNGVCVIRDRLLYEVPAHLQSNTTVETDARKSSVRGSP